ncbi:MAG: hypothetical protein ACP5E3_20735 [Bacteroidales bacterium]
METAVKEVMESFKHNPFMEEALTKIDSSIRKGCDLSEILSRAIPAYKKELFCEEGWVFKVKMNGSFDPHIDRVYPEANYMNRPFEYITLFRNFLLLFDKHVGSSFNRRFPFTGQLSEKIFFHMFHLKGFGYLVLIKKDTKLPCEVLKSLQEVNSKLAHACIYAEKVLS